MNIVIQITEKDMQKGSWVREEVLRLAERLSGAEAAPMPEPAQEAPEPEKPDAPAVDEGFRMTVRKTLAELNKKAGKNIASELIKGFGVEKLTEVALADLPALMEKAKEALDNAG